MSRTQELEKIKALIEKHYGEADCGLFDCSNWAGDPMTNIYAGEYFDLDICYGWSYFEVFGTTAKEFKSLLKFYDGLANK